MKYPLENRCRFEDSSDEGIRQQVCKALKNSCIPGEDTLKVEVSDGVVVLSGELEADERAKVEALVKGLHHVKGLVSQLHPF